VSAYSDLTLNTFTSIMSSAYCVGLRTSSPISSHNTQRPSGLTSAIFD
jgi:hypothetical protein